MEAHVNVRVDPSSAELVLGQPDIDGFFGVTGWRNNGTEHCKDSLTVSGQPQRFCFYLPVIQPIVLALPDLKNTQTLICSNVLR